MKNTVLIIDDDLVLRNALSAGLQKEGFYTITADSAEQGSDILSRIRPDAIVLDRMMCGMDGLTFLKSIRAKGNQVPVIMLTAMAGAENAIDGLQGGANDYLAKPFQLQELVLRLKNIMKDNKPAESQMPEGLFFTDNEFFIKEDSTDTLKVISLSGEEKKLLINLTSPVGNIVPASPMVAKRLRNKLNIVLSNIDIITVRGKGYKIISKTI